MNVTPSIGLFDRCIQPQLDQVQQGFVAHATSHALHQFRMRDRVEVTAEVRVHHFRIAPLIQQLVNCLHRIQGAAVRLGRHTVRVAGRPRRSAPVRSAPPSAMTRSLIVGIPNGRCLPSGFGMYTRRTACGWYVFFLSSSASSSSHSITPHASRCPRTSGRSTPGAPSLIERQRGPSIPQHVLPSTPCRTASRSGMNFDPFAFACNASAVSELISSIGRLIANLPALRAASCVDP